MGSERSGYGSGRPDLGSERPQLCAERPDLGSERLDLRSWRPKGAAVNLILSAFQSVDLTILSFCDFPGQILYHVPETNSSIFHLLTSQCKRRQNLTSQRIKKFFLLNHKFFFAIL